MNVVLRERLVDKLVALPETGMGYQIVDLVLRDGRVLSRVTVLNAMSASIPDNAKIGDVDDIVDVRLSA